MKITGVFGGTFDPIHFGHLRPVLEVYQDLPVEEVRWIPSANPPHRSSPQVSIVHRLNMLRLALQGTEFIIDERELQRPGPSYMSDTLASLKQEYPDKSLALILGMDAFCGLPGWHRWKDLLQLAHIIVCYRPGADLPDKGELAAIIDERQTRDVHLLLTRDSGLIYMHPVTQLAVSATMIRDACQQGKSPQFLLPESVHDYIQKNHLYQKRPE